MPEPQTRVKSKISNTLIIVASIVVFLIALGIFGYYGSFLRSFITAGSTVPKEGYLDEVNVGGNSLVTAANVEITGTPTITNTDPAIGNVTAPLKIILFGNYTSGNTAAAFDVYTSIRADYGDTVRIIWKDYYGSQDSRAKELAIAGRCAQRQGKFWEYLNGVFNQPGGLAKVVVDDIAKNLSLNLDQWHSCQTDSTVQRQIDSNITEAIGLHLEGVPTFFIGDQVISGVLPYSQIKQVIDRQLQ